MLGGLEDVFLNSRWIKNKRDSPFWIMIYAFFLLKDICLLKKNKKMYENNLYHKYSKPHRFGLYLQQKFKETGKGN